ncbi:MAG: type III secretion system protein HrpB [Syntrophorhabdus sp. PtaU1.Bin050]|nr:MAG: type III secretion system protein HrpB [Syntrophorhabdus sp. PtaU1.Bin050]
MSLESIRKAVMEASRTEASRIVSAAQRQTEEQLKKERERAWRKAELLYEAQARIIEEDYARRVVQFQGKAAKILLERRNARLREIFAEARVRILALPEEEYREIMQRLLERAAGPFSGKVRIHPPDREIFANVIEAVNRGRSPENYVSFDENSVLTEQGGFIFVGSTFEVDQTLTTILDEIERELLPAIARDLFPS